MAIDKDVLSPEDQTDQFRFVRQGPAYQPRDHSALGLLLMLAGVVFAVIAGAYLVEHFGRLLPEKTTDVFALTRDLATHTNTNPWIFAGIAWGLYVILALWILDRTIIAASDLAYATHTPRMNVLFIRSLQMLRWVLAMIVTVAFGYFFM